MSGSAFLNIAREVDDSIPSYNKFMDERREKNQSTTRSDYYSDVIMVMTEEERIEFYRAMIGELEPLNPKGLGSLKELFPTTNSVIRKKEVPSIDQPLELYRDILETIHSCYRSAEQKPSMSLGKGEEDLRDLALTFLESRYESAVASGESFNKEGKTDIIIKSQEGNNLFVAECKVWSGAEQFHKTLDQLFGYLTWRDTKAAIVFFVRNLKFSEVLAKIKEEAGKSKYFVEHVSDTNDTSFSFKFRHKDDNTRIVNIEIMAYHFTK